MKMIADRPQYVTPNGLREIEARLDYLRNVRRPEVAARLRQAREEGGELIDNAAYEDARNEQAFVEGEIQRLETMLVNAHIIENTSPPDIVGLGDKVKVQEKGHQQIDIFHIVGAVEASPSQGRISNESPLGRALMGRRVGEQVTAHAPDGDLVFTIKAIFT
jgi:transcription elongation factor GreA